MGFFSNLIKDEVKKAVNTLVEEAKSGELFNSNNTNNSNNTSINTGNSSAKPNTNNQSRVSGIPVLRSRLETIIANEYPEYELRREIPASLIGADSRAKSYSYGLYLNGSPKAFIMIMDNRNHHQKLEVRLAKEAAKNQGIPYMNFMGHLPNEESYISNRLRNNILG